MSQSNAFGLMLGIVLISLLFAMAHFLFGPRGPAELVRGVVLGLGFRETDLGSRHSASVLVEGRRVVVTLPNGHNCLRGRSIQLQKRSLRTGGVLYTATIRGCRGLRR